MVNKVFIYQCIMLYFRIRLYPPCYERKLININIAQKTHKPVSAFMFLILKKKTCRADTGGYEKSRNTMNTNNIFLYIRLSAQNASL